MNLSKVTFPIYKMRKYISIDKNPLGLVKVTTIKGVFILDDISINKAFPERRLLLRQQYPKHKIYNLKERVVYLRQLVKYNSGTIFIDHSGELIKYVKSTRLFDITCHKITRNIPYGRWSIINVNGIETPFIVGERVTSEYASIMNTVWGPFLYDLTSEKHESYKRKI